MRSDNERHSFLQSMSSRNFKNLFSVMHSEAAHRHREHQIITSHSPLLSAYFILFFSLPFACRRIDSSASEEKVCACVCRVPLHKKIMEYISRLMACARRQQETFYHTIARLLFYYYCYHRSGLAY